MSRETSLGVATTKQLCEAFGISKQAYSVARRPRTEQAPEGPRKPPRQCLTWLSAEELRQAIQEVLAYHRGWGVRKVWAFLRREEKRASYKRVYAFMKAMGVTFESTSCRTKDTTGHITVPESNRRWATDMTTIWTRKDGNVAVTPVIDCGDRFVFKIGVSKSQESWALLTPVEQALMAVFGDTADLPAGLELRTDHGPQYTGGDCSKMCDGWNLEHTFAPVGRPTGNAVAERFIQTMKVEVFWLRDWDSLQEVNEAVQAWLETYNHERPHQSLGWLTPAEKRALNLPKAPALPEKLAA